MKNNELTGYSRIDLPQNKDAKFFEKKPIIPNVDIYTLLKLTSLPNQSKIAVDCDDLTVNYKQFLNDIKTLSNALKELGVKKGDIISVCMPNYYQSLLCYFAANRLGAITTYLNSFSSREEICDYLNLYESPILINFNRSAEHNNYLKNNSKVKYIITLGKESVNDLDFNKKVNHDYLLDFNAIKPIADYKKNSIELPHSKKDDSLILYTSGTTGNPKSVVLTNENVMAAQMYMMNTSHTQNLDVKRLLTCVPFSYPYGLCTSAVASVLWSKETILAPYLSVNNIAYYYSKKPNMVMGSPAFLSLTMKTIPDNFDLSSVKYFISGGDFLSQSHAERGALFFQEHGADNVDIGNGFGNAETVSIGSTPFGLPIKENSVGKVLVGSSCMIIDPETKEEKKYNEEGIICMHGKHVFKKYYGNEELTNEVKFLKDGQEFFNTGTLGKIDEDGYLFITGREARFYIISTLNKVYCDNIQKKMSSIDVIDDIAVVKVPDDEMLYVNKAYIVLNNKADSIEDVEDYIRQQVSKTQLKEYEYPTYYEFVEELPRKIGSDKVDYTFLENDALKELNKDNMSLSKKI